MQKIILDTNVLVSALISQGPPFQILDKVVLGGKVELQISLPIWEEYVEVLNRKKFSRFPDFFAKAELTLSYIRLLSTEFHPKEKVDLIKDYPDNRFLELAAEGKADFLITGNTNDFVFDSFESTKIVTPTEYWTKFKPEI